MSQTTCQMKMLVVQYYNFWKKRSNYEFNYSPITETTFGVQCCNLDKKRGKIVKETTTKNNVLYVQRVLSNFLNVLSLYTKMDKTLDTLYSYPGYVMLTYCNKNVQVFLGDILLSRYHVHGLLTNKRSNIIVMFLISNISCLFALWFFLCIYIDF